MEIQPENLNYAHLEDILVQFFSNVECLCRVKNKKVPHDKCSVRLATSRPLGREAADRKRRSRE